VHNTEKKRFIAKGIICSLPYLIVVNFTLIS
jgi:hypothetical protein